MATVQNWNLGKSNPYSDLGWGTPTSTIRRISEPTTQTQTAIVEQASPEDIASAYESSYGNLLRDPSNFGVSPEETGARYSKITDYLRDTGRSGFLGEMADRGYAPTGGTQIHGMADIEARLGAQQAEAELGAQERQRVRQGNVAGQGAASRYNALVNRRKTTTQTDTTTPGATTLTAYQPDTFGGFVGAGKTTGSGSASNPYKTMGTGFFEPWPSSKTGLYAGSPYPFGKTSYQSMAEDPLSISPITLPDPSKKIPGLLPNERT